MKSKNNIQKIVQELFEHDFNTKLSIKEKAAYEMLQQKKIRKLLNNDER